MAWRGIGDDQTIYWAWSDDGDNWSDRQPISNVGTADTPVLTVVNGRLFMLWRGIQEDWHLYMTWQTGDGNWQPQQEIPGGLSGGRVSAIAYPL
jgi:hypothetical protein